MKNQKPSPVVLVAVALVLVLIGTLGTLVWQDSQDDTVEIQFGDGSVRFETGELK